MKFVFSSLIALGERQMSFYGIPFVQNLDPFMYYTQTNGHKKVNLIKFVSAIIIIIIIAPSFIDWLST
jgi:hypothetical protein